MLPLDPCHRLREALRPPGTKLAVQRRTSAAQKNVAPLQKRDRHGSGPLAPAAVRWEAGPHAQMRIPLK
jgi:hypothetical protein